MRKKKTIIISVIVLVLIVITVITGNRYSTLADRESGFAVEDTASVVAIYIADKGGNEMLLERTGDHWNLDSRYVANTRMVDMLLGTIHNIRVKAPVSLASHDNVIRRMAAIGRKVEIYQMVYRIDLFDKIRLFKHKKRTKVFYVGDPTQDNLGTHMLMEGADQAYIVYLPSFRGFISSRFTPMSDEWRSHVIFNEKLVDIQSVEVKFIREPENSFKVESKGSSGDYDLISLAANKKLDGYDTLKILNFLTSFRDLRYESRLNNLMSPVRIDSILNSPPLYEIELVDQQGTVKLVRMFEKKASTEEETNLLISQIPVDFDRMYGSINDGEDFVLLQYYVFDKVLYPLSHYEQ